MTKAKHPCAGRSQRQVEIFEAIAVNLEPPFSPRSLRALLDAGLVEQVGVRVLGRDAFGAIKVPVYAVPLPVHYQWCQWCSENVGDEDV